MLTKHEPRDVIRQVTEWAEAKDAVRAVLLTSSRANPHAAVDVLSDYDVVLVVRDVLPFYEDRSWLQDLGEVLVVYWDPIHPAPGYGVDEVSNVTLYASDLAIDFNVWPTELLQQIAQAPHLPAGLDDGYTVLLDKDHLTERMPPPTYTAYVPSVPGEDAYQKTIQDFFSDVPYVAKCLWRDELLPAKWCLENDMKHVFLRRMLEWRVEIDHGWSVPAGNLGRGLREHLPPDIWAELEHTYAGAGITDNWEALFRTLALFRRVAIEVAESLGYTYPTDLDERVTAYALRVKNLDDQAATVLGT